MTVKGIVIAGTHSGAGKTTVTLGLLAALVRRGLRVAAFKVGPDFIDPGHHRRITGAPSRNLDGWMLSRDYNLNCFDQAVQGMDLAVVEGVMGLFDGLDGRSEAGSSAQMAKWLGLPVLLVVDARSMARSAAALVQGFERFDRDLDFAGVLFNHLGGARHLAYIEEALADHVRMPCLGGLVRDEALAIPERHLGLVTAQDHDLDRDALARLADSLEGALDLDGLLARLPQITPRSSAAAVPPAPSLKVRLGVARDRAFCFYYPDNLEMLAAAGARLVFFSPLDDTDLPPDLDGLYLGGGYPELHAAQLAANTTLGRQIRAHSQDGMPIYGECGGFMYLGRSLTDLQGRTWPMLDCLALDFRMNPRLRSLGYREIRLAADTLLGSAGTLLRGHEFHYSQLCADAKPATGIYRVSDRAGEARGADGFISRQTLGSYVHLHFGSHPQAAGHFIRACAAYRARRGSTGQPTLDA